MPWCAMKKKPSPKQLKFQAKKAKKALKLRRKKKAKVKAKNRQQAEEAPSGLAPRYIRRKKQLAGMSFWRGDRYILPNYIW